jgi:hypothetical protein
MATFTFVDVELAEASVLADLSGAAIDLEASRDLAKYLAGRFAAGAVGEFEVVDAFTTAILVRYARPFMTGVRLPLGADILGGLSAEQMQLHLKFLAWRSKHIAHSVNPFEENLVVAYYNQDTVTETGIQSISVQQDRLVGLSMRDLADIQSLADAILSIVKARIDAEKARVLEIVRSRPIAEVLRVGIKPRGSAGISSVNKARKRT